MTGFALILPFLRPIEPLILDPNISEIMVNGCDRVYIERNGYLEAVTGVTLTEKSLMVAVKNIARRLVSRVRSSFTKSGHRFQNFVGRFDPDQGF